MSISDNIQSGKYENKMVHPNKRDIPNVESYKEATKEYRLESKRLINLFKSDALEELGISNHPKGDKLFELCLGNGGGYYEIWNLMQEWSELLTD